MEVRRVGRGAPSQGHRTDTHISHKSPGQRENGCVCVRSCFCPQTGTAGGLNTLWGPRGLEETRENVHPAAVVSLTEARTLLANDCFNRCLIKASGGIN